MRPFALLASLLMIITACGGSSTQTSSTAETVPHLTGASDVVIQLGDYVLNSHPDGYVIGQELFVYGDGSVYARLYDGVAAGVASFRLVKGKLAESTIQDLLGRAGALPASTPVGTAPIDGIPLVLMVAGHRWDINDLSVKAFASYIEYLQATIAAGAVEAWQPTRWISLPFGTNACSVVEQPSGDGANEAPVYPHAVSNYPLGTFTC